MGIKILSWEGMVAAYIAVVAMLASQAGIAQEKQNLERRDYHKWGTLYAEQVSPTGEWVSFSMKYSTHQDTLTVKNRKGKTVLLPNGKSGRFANDDYFACLLTGQQLVVIDLHSFEKKTFSGISSFAIAENGKCLLMHKKGQDGKGVLDILHLGGKILQSEPDVMKYAVSPSSNAIVFTKAVDGKEVLYYESLQNNKPILVTTGKGSVLDWTWQQNSKSFAFLEQGNETTAIGHFAIAAKSLRWLSDAQLQEGYHFRPSFTMGLAISPDGKRVFFLEAPQQPREKETVKMEIWDSADKWVFNKKAEYGHWKDYPKLALWWPDNGKYKRIGSDSLPQAMTGNNKRLFLQFNPEGKTKSYKQYGNADFWLTDTETGESKLLLKDQSLNANTVTLSPQEKFVLYYRDGHWWLYDIAKKAHRNLTKEINIECAEEGYDYAGEKPAYGIAAWASNDTAVMLYDKNDIWEFDTQKSTAKRLTNGKEKQMVFRLARPKGATAQNMAFDGFVWPVWDREKESLLSAKSEDGKYSGFYLLHLGLREKELVYDTAKADQLLQPSDSRQIYYRTQRFDSPPAMIHVSKTSAKKVFQSNRQHFKYNWGTASQMAYQNSQGESLNAIVFYPADYSPQKKYPTVVHIYEKLSGTINDYINPGMYNETGFNIANLVTLGYVVLCPDINYTIGNPGGSAVDCVTAATKKLIEVNIADPKRIALHGHSFGGYETNFIITQTDLFCTAIAGAGATDMASWYFTMGWNDNTPHMWRFEDQQWRMGKSYYDDVEGYNRNSPIFRAQKITTPLLSWAGKKDGQVNWEQSMELYLALRRLDKKNTFLLFPDEGHFITDPGNQESLTQKIEQWLAHYLRGQEPARWMRS